MYTICYNYTYHMFVFVSTYSYDLITKLMKYITRQFYIGVNRKYPGSLDHVFLRVEVTQAQNWGTVLTPY